MMTGNISAPKASLPAVRTPVRLAWLVAGYPIFLAWKYQAIMSPTPIRMPGMMPPRNSLTTETPAVTP